MLAARFIMFYAAGRANTEECFGLIEHGYYVGEWMVAAVDQIGGTVYGRLFPLSRRCLRPPLATSSPVNQLEVKVIRVCVMETCMWKWALKVRLPLAFSFFRMKVLTAGSRMSCSPCSRWQLGAGAEHTRATCYLQEEIEKDKSAAAVNGPGR